MLNYDHSSQLTQATIKFELKRLKFWWGIRDRDRLHHKKTIVQLNDADPKGFHLIPKLAVILTLSFIHKTKNQKNDWKLCQPLLHNQGVSLVGYLKYQNVFQKVEFDRPGERSPQ